jgi:hypothetical protein
MNVYMSEQEFEEKCKAQGLKKQADGSWAEDGHYDKRVNYNTATGNVSNGGGIGNRAFESTLNDGINRATGN